MQPIGMNAMRITAGPWSPRPPTATMKPSVAARLYAGAVDATAMTMPEMNEMAPVFSPLSPAADPAPVTMGAGITADSTGPILSGQWAEDQTLRRYVVRAQRTSG